MEFIDKGVYGDEDMPFIEDFRKTVMGFRDSPIIDVRPAIEELGTIRSGMVSWFSRPLIGTEIDILTSMDDGESWKLIDNNSFIKNPKELNKTPEIRLRYVIRSIVADLFPEKSPKVYSVSLTLSNKSYSNWEDGDKYTLKWKGDN